MKLGEKFNHIQKLGEKFKHVQKIGGKFQTMNNNIHHVIHHNQESQQNQIYKSPLEKR